MSEEQEKRKPQKWKCPRCGTLMTTYVGLSDKPTCRNPESHSAKIVEMEEITK